MADLRFKDLTEAATPGSDYWVPTDSASDGVRKMKPSNLVSKSDIGLGNVNNTSDADKPISDLTQAALDGKASAAQGAKADSAVQPGDLGDLATKDKAAISDISAAGTADGSHFLRGDGVWAVPGGGGDMLSSAYDPEEIAGNAFNLANQYGRKPTQFATLAALVADDDLSYSATSKPLLVAANDIVEAQGHRYSVAASDATDHDLATSGGVKLNLLRGPDGRYSLSALGIAQGGDITAAISAFFNKIRAVGYPETVVVDDFWLVSESIRIPYNVKLYGAGLGLLRAAAPFTGVTFDVAGGGTYATAPLLWCAETPGDTNIATIGSDSGSRREGLYIDQTVTLDCNAVSDVGLFIDNIQNSFMNCRIEKAVAWGVIDYHYGWGNRHYESVISCGEGGIWSRNAGNGVDMSGAQIWGYPTKPTVAHVLIDGDNNGVNIRLGYIEEGTVGVLLRAGNGPCVISGVDIEIMDEEAIIVDGTGVSGRPAGPVTITGCFLETNSTTKAVVKAINAIVRVNGCRIRNLSGATASGLAAFETSGSDAVIFDDGNQIEATIGNRYVSGVVTNTQGGRATVRRLVRDSSTSLDTMEESTVHGDQYNYALPLASDKIESIVFDAGTQEVGSRRSITAENHLAGATSGVSGLVIDSTQGSTLGVHPPSDNTNQLGRAARQWTTIYLVSAPVVSSDRRLKNVHHETIPSALLDAWQAQVKYGAYSWKADDGKGLRAGLFAQDIIAAFEEAGIDWREWAIIEIDENGFYHVVKDEAQAIENAMIRRKLLLG